MHSLINESLSSSRATLIEKCLTNIRYHEVDVVSCGSEELAIHDHYISRLCTTAKYEPIRGIDVDTDRDNDRNLSPYFPFSLHVNMRKGGARRTNANPQETTIVSLSFPEQRRLIA